MRRAAGFDGFVMVTPEYNHSTSGALRNALDFLYNEWNNIVRRRSDVRSSDLPSS